MASGIMYRLYTTGDPNGNAEFYVGRVPDGRGLMAGECSAELLVIWFNRRGRMTGQEVVPLLPSSEGRDTTTQILDWLTRVGFRAEPVEIEGFSINEPMDVGFSPYPSWALYPNPDADPADPEMQARAEFFRRWDEKGGFVVHWGGRNLYLGKDGGYST